MDCFALMGRRIKEARKSNGYTQAALAEMVEMSTQHISNIETGKTKLSIGLFIRLANVLNVSADTLMCDCVPVSEESLNHEFLVATAGCTDVERRRVLDYAKSIIGLVQENEM